MTAKTDMTRNACGRTEVGSRAPRRVIGGPALRMLLLLLALLLLAAVVVAGCGSAGNSAGTSPASTAQTATTDVTGASAAGNTTTTAAPARKMVSFTDQAGRTVSIPDPIEKVYCTSPIGTNLMYTLAPEMLVGWNVTPSASEKEYIPENLRGVVGMGGWYGKNTTGNVEEIIKRSPDVVLDIGTLDSSMVSQADRIQGLLHVPVIMVDGTLVNTGDTYRYLGKLLHVESRAEELAQYADRIIAQAKANSAKIKDSERVAVYYAEGAKGLNTDPAGSMHTEVLDLIGAKNIAQVPVDQSGFGMSPVSLEQVIAWDPSVILVASDPTNETQAYELITTGSDWATISAVKNKRVYQIPHGPFDWFDRPPCVARILGVEWLGNLLYPDLYKMDIKAEIKNFYKVFFHYDLSDEQLMTLAGRALPSQ